MAGVLVPAGAVAGDRGGAAVPAVAGAGAARGRRGGGRVAGLVAPAPRVPGRARASAQRPLGAARALLPMLGEQTLLRYRLYVFKTTFVSLPISPVHEKSFGLLTVVSKFSVCQKNINRK